jgi:acyl-[acyl-carrier-protein]-phospholipid O-acyltransferase/long-chain-fatty-acid--[acyl-carrier-protein] ligase
MGSLPIMLAALFLRGIQSSCYSPSKFGMLPEIPAGEAFVMGKRCSRIGIVSPRLSVAQVAGTSLYGMFSDRLGYAGVILLGVTLSGVLVSSTLPRVRPAGSTKPFRVNPLGELMEEWRSMRTDRTLHLAILGNTYFLSVGYSAPAGSG